MLHKVLECCGRIQKWNRPPDPATGAPKAFGFVTFEYGASALRCKNVLTDVEVHGVLLQIKAGTKEQAALDVMAEDENLTDSSEGADALVRDKITQLLRVPPKPFVDPSTVTSCSIESDDASVSALPTDQQQQSASVPALVEPETSTSIFTIAPGLASSHLLNVGTDDEFDTAETNKGKHVMSEIEKFRSRQVQRDKELEEDRVRKMKDKIKHLQKLQDYDTKKNLQVAAESAMARNIGDYIDTVHRSEEQKKRIEVDARAKENLNHYHDQQQKKSHEREPDDEITMEAKRRRKQLVLQMLSDENEFSQESDIPPSQAAAEAALSVKVKLGVGIKKSAASTATFIAQGQNEDVKPLRTIVPIDFTEEERKQESLYRYALGDYDNEDLEGKVKKSRLVPLPPQPVINAPTDSVNAQMVAFRQAQAIAAEIAAKIAVTSTNAKDKLSKPTLTTEEEAIKLKQKLIVDQIPTDQASLFAFKMDWAKVESLGIIQSVMKTWVTKKVVEYLGEVEETLIHFIISKLNNQCNPNELLGELAAVLDDDAEQFVIKLWRMLIFSVLKN